MTLRVIYEPKGRAAEYAPLAANLYRGCGHGCLYCYAPDVLHMKAEDFHNATIRSRQVLSSLELDAAELQRAGDKRPILLSFTTDCYQPLDVTEKLTRRALDILLSHGLNVTILTKGGRRSLRDFDYFATYHKQVTYATTLTFLESIESKQWEPGAASPAERIAILSEAHKLGLKTWVSCEPVIDPVQTLALIRFAAPYTDLFKIGTWNHDVRANRIDWKKFAGDAVALLDELGKPYYLKEDLRIKMAKPSGYLTIKALWEGKQ